MTWLRWNQLLLPTVLISGMWLLFSIATRLTIGWLEHGYQRMLDENVTTIESVGEMQHALWVLQDGVFKQVPVPAVERRSDFDQLAATQDFRQALQKADRTALTVREQELVKKIRIGFDAYLLDLKQAPQADDDPVPGERALELAAEISELSDKLLEINQDLIDEHTLFYRSWSSRIRWAGISLTVIGPVLGIWLGLRASSKLRQRMMRLRVTLAGAAGDVRSIDVAPDVDRDELAALDDQARIAATRIADVLKQLEVARLNAAQNERLAVVGQIAAGVAHELRNPLTSVKLLVQTIAVKAGSERDDQESFDVLTIEIERMERTIQSLLDYARPTVSHVIRHDVQADVARAVNLVRARAERDGVPITIAPRSAPMPVTADPDLMQQVFVNLLLNALDAMSDEEGQSTDSSSLKTDTSGHCFNHGEVGRQPPRSIDIAYAELSAENELETHTPCVWRVIVRDRGPGLPDGQTEQIFAPFMTTKARGTGLGLAVSRRIIEEHNGRLTANNHPDGGAVFVVDLPFADD